MEKRTCLNGFWDFSMEVSMDTFSDASMDGERDGREPVAWDSHKICVPSPYNINAFARIREKKLAGEPFYVQGGDFCLYPDYPPAWNNAECGAYRRTFFIPEESRGKRIFLHFDAVAYHSKFYVNGALVKEEVEAFLPIEVEITDVARFGKDNEIIVVAENSKKYMYKDEKNWNRIDYPKGSFWGEFAAGIWQDVWYVERPAVYISDVFVVTDIWKETLTAKFTLDGAGKGEAGGNREPDGAKKDGTTTGKVRFTLIDLETNEEKALGECSPADGVFEWSYSGEAIRLWDIDSPSLYQLKAELLEGGEVRDTKLVRFGFRSFIAKGERFYLNKKPLNLKNDSWHYMGYSIQTPEYARSYYKMAKAAGVNIIRLHAQPFPSFFYDIADEMGMLLVSESAVWASHCNFSYNDAFFENSRRHLIRLILRDRNHPSVVLWSPENECIPAYRYCGSKFIKDEQDLEYKLYEFLKVIYEYDTSRLISCDGSGDLGGRLQINSLHYPGFDCPTQHGKPITIGEMGSMYYSTPDMVCMEKGQETLLSAENRLWAVGEDAYRNLMGERRWASQVCVFNLIWYGLEPLPFQDRLLTYDDYTAPGIKPGRITPYLRMLNAGGDDSLPEYIPNPVWKLTQKAYLPVRSYIDRMPEQVYAGEASRLPLFLFYDERDDGSIAFKLTLETDGQVVDRQEYSYEMKACEAQETTVSIQWPEKAGEVKCTALVELQGKTVYEETYLVNVFEKSALISEWEALQIPCTMEEEAKEGVSGIYCKKNANPEQSWELCHIFNAEKRLSFAKPVSCVREDVQGLALYFDGSGQPVAWYVEEKGIGKIVSAIDLTQPAEAAQWLLLLELGKYLKQKKAKQTREILFYGKEDSPYGELLRKLHYAYRTVDEETVKGMLSDKQDAILFADGSMSMDFLPNINRNNFDTVVIAGLTKTPKQWHTEFDVTGKHTYQAYPSTAAVEQFGIYGTKLYGLTVGEECVIGEKLLEFRKKPAEGTIFWKIPDIDWRMWNNDPEEIKTVSLHRSEQVDNSRLAVLSLMRRGESNIWINQLTPDAEHAKRGYLWKNFLAGIGAGYGNAAEVKQSTETVYDDGLCCLWEEESGKMLTRKQQLSEGVRTGCIIYSPQDRTDFLYNPDVIHMEIRGEKPLEVYLNGQLLGEEAKAEDGAADAPVEMKFTSICLKAGENRLILVPSREQGFPEIRFERVKGKLDLEFYPLQGV